MKMREKVSDALKAEFRTLNVQWFVYDAANDGPCDTTPWTLLAEAAFKAMREPTAEMDDAGLACGPDRDHGTYWRAMIDAALES